MASIPGLSVLSRMLGIRCGAPQPLPSAGAAASDEPRNGTAVVGILVPFSGRFRDGSEPELHALAVRRAGGRPVFLAPGAQAPKEQLKSVDALIVPGGGDVDPTLYGQQDHGLCYGISPDYDRFEIGMIKEAWDVKLPMLAVCRGQQITNVAGGGGLIQDLPSEYKSPNGIRVSHNGGNWHEINIQPGSKLAELLSCTRATVNSLHHQAVAMTHLSPLLVVTAQALDGVVEGVQRKDCDWQIGVQFHPEMMMVSDPRMQRLYDNLVQKGIEFHRPG